MRISKVWTLRAALLAGACLAAPDFAAAQSGGVIEEVVVTARKREESLQEVPVAVTAFSGETLKNQSVQNVKDIQQQTPSLSMNTGSSGRNSVVVTIRGQTNNDLLLTVDPAVGIYVDGVSLAKTITSDLANLVDVERVEVLKGPQGTLYGRNTTGGSVNIFTKTPTGDAGGEVTARVGSYNRYGANLIVNLPIKGEDLALRVAGGFDKRDAWGKNIRTGKGVGGDLDGGSVRATLRVAPTSDVEVLLRGDYTKSTTTSIPYRAQGLVPTSAAAPFIGNILGLGAAATTPAGRATAAAAYAASGSAGGFYDTNSDFNSLDNAYSWGTSATVNVTLRADMLFKSITGYRTANRRTFYDLDGSPFQLLHTNGYTHQEVFSQELNLNGQALDNRLQWIVGGYYSREFGFDGTQSVSFNSFATRSFNEGHVINKSLAAFSQATFKVTDALSFTGGLRYTEEKKHLTSANRRLDGVCNLPVALRQPGQCIVLLDQKWNKLNYTASVDFKPAEGILVYAKTSTGFRSGGENLRGGIDPNTFAPFNPENVRDYEVGLKSDLWDRRLRINLAAYHTDYKNIQRVVLIPSTLNPTSTVVRNAASAKINGAEAEVTVVPVDNLTLKFTGSLTDPKYKKYLDAFGNDLSGLPFVFIPKKAFSLSASYAVPMENGDLRLQADYAYKGTVYYDDDSLFNGTNGLPELRRQKGFGLLNGRISKRFENQKLEIAVYGKNLLAKKYYVLNLDTSTTALGFNVQMPGDRRIFGLDVTKAF